MPAPEPFWLEHQSFYIVPVCHYRFEFAREVRRAFEALQPQRVALELPHFLMAGFERAVQRLPCLTLLTFEVTPAEAQGPLTMMYQVEPTDAFVEATRSALQAGVPRHAIDLPMLYSGLHEDPVPDSASLTAIGARAFWEQWQQHSPASGDAQDRQREAYMANKLLALSRQFPEDKILVVVGLAHVAPLLEYLRAGDAPLMPPSEFHAGPVKLQQPEAEVTQAIHEEIPWIMTLYELERGGPGPESAWVAPPQPQDEPVADLRDKLKGIDPAQFANSLESLLGGGLEAALGLKKRPPTRPLTPQQKRAMARYLQGLSEEPSALFQLLSQFGQGTPPTHVDLPPVEAPPAFVAFTFRQVEDRRGELLELYRKALVESQGLDRQRLVQSLIHYSSGFYHENTGDQVVPWQLETLYQYLRNYARLQGRLLPRLYEIAMGTRGVADDNLAYEVWDLGGFYPWVSDEGGEGNCDCDPLPLFRMQDLENVRPLRSWFFRRTYKRLRKRAKEGAPGEWSDEFDGSGGICSYPPEDIVIEDYARYLQKKAIQQMSEEKTRVEPFTTSLLDGIDMRETLRNWHDRKLFVREIKRVQGGVGAVILIFDEDLKSNRYPWCMTWHGEHSQESDMAFYATPANMKIVGPGISRCEYGGMLMTYPNRRLANVWADVYYRECRSKAEVLLMGALEYGLDRHVVYVAAEPPRSHFRSVAGRLGKKIVYVPIGSLSPQSIQRIRVFHVLSDHGKRQIAKDFIW
jgi:hypothetical protein